MTRAEVFKRKFVIYQKLNRLAAAVLHESIKYEIDPAGHGVEMVRARLTLSEFIVESSLIISEKTGPLFVPILESNIPPNVNAIREALNAVITQMAKELKLDSILSINDLLHK